MTKEEVFEILVVIENEFPRYYSNQNEMQKSGKLNLWYSIFKDDDKKAVNRALYKVIATSPYPPSVAEIRKSMVETTVGYLNTSGEAWGEVQRAIHRFGYLQGEKALEEMSEITRQAVSCMGWGAICMSDVENSMADRAHFMRIYEGIANRKTQEKMLPAALANKIEEAIALNKPKKEISHIEEKQEPVPVKSSVPKEFSEALIKLREKMKM